MVSNSTGELFAAVLCAVECEYQALIRAIPPNGALSGDQYVTTMPSGRRVLVRRQRSMGNYAAAVTTTQIILEERPENLILAGIAGGFPSDDRRLGDLLVADQVIAYESAKLRGEAVELRPQAFRTSFDLVAASEAVFRGEEWRKRIAVVPPEQQADGPKLHVGTTLSGDKVVAKSGFMEEFRALWTKTTGIEMEAAGAMTAVHLSKLQPRFLMIKAICDHADEDKADGWQPYAADVAAAFVAEMLDSKAMGQLPERVAATPSAALTGEERHEIQERMYRDWDQIATYFGVSHRERSGFRRGQESQEIWDWLMSRRRLHELPAALLCVSRQDIVNRFPRLADKLMAEQEAQKA
nr:hypothetical protein [Methylobacterium fujisawaense]